MVHWLVAHPFDHLIYKSRFNFDNEPGILPANGFLRPKSINRFIPVHQEKSETADYCSQCKLIVLATGEFLVPATYVSQCLCPPKESASLSNLPADPLQWQRVS